MWQPEEYCLQFYNLPSDVKAYEIYPQLMSQMKLNVLAIYTGVLDPNAQNDFSSSRCYRLLEEYVIQTNQHLVQNTFKREARYFQTVDDNIIQDYEKNPANYGIMHPQTQKNFGFLPELSPSVSKESFLEKPDLTKLIENIVNLPQQKTDVQSSSPIVLFFDDKKKIQETQIKDIILFKQITENKRVATPELYVKRLFHSRKNLSFKGFYYSFETFDACMLQNIANQQHTFRQYWDLKNVEDYTPNLKAEFKKIYFHEKDPESGSLASLLNLDLVCQIAKTLEIRISLTFQYLEAYHDQDKVCWLIFLTKHPECYFYPLKPNEYLAFHLKNWRRVPNFLLGSMPDNIDRLYLNGNRNIIRLTFNKDYYTEKHSSFFQAYENQLIKLGRFKRIHQPVTIPTVPFSNSHSLKLTTKKIHEAKVPFEIKFLLMAMISKSQIDVYTLPENFLEKIWDLSSNDKIKPFMIKTALEMIVFNKAFDHTFISYDKFKQEHSKNILLVRNKEKMLDTYSAGENDLALFDANLFTFELQITPSCIYYLCSDVAISKIILYKFYGHVERLLLVKFIDENLDSIKTVRSTIAEFYYKKFLSQIKLFDRVYEFFSFTSPQIENRSFWAFSSTKGVEADQILQFLEKHHQDQSFLNPSNIMSYVTKVSDQIRYSYDTLEVFDEHINVSSIPLTNKILEDSLLDGQFSKNSTCEGFISADLLQNIADKFNYGNIPGVVLRNQSKEFLLLKDPDNSHQKSLQFYQNIFSQYQLETVDHFEIVEIPRYRSAFLNNHLILLMESFFKKNFENEYSQLVLGVQTVLQQHLEKFSFKEVGFFNSISFSSRNANNALQPILSSYQYFPREAYFQQLSQSVFDRSLSDIMKKMKLNTKFGAYILGIVDYKGILGKDEVYYDIENPLEQSAYKENLFPHVLIARKPCLDLYQSYDHDYRDLRIFKIKTLHSHPENPFQSLKNCLVFSQHDKDFVFNSCSNLGSLSRANYFLLFWDQHFIPEQFRKILPPSNEKANKSSSNLILKNCNKSDQSVSYYFEREGSKLSEYLDGLAHIDDVCEKYSPSFHEKSKLYRNFMQSKFLALIRNPRMKDIKALHLAYADISRIKCHDDTARLLSKSFREFNIFDPLKAFSDEQIYNLLNILESSKYLSVPFYNKDTRSIHSVGSKSFLTVIYQKISEWYAVTSQERETHQIQFSINQNLIYKGFESHIKSALKVLILYRYDIQRLCFLYGCVNESDLFIGFNRKDNHLSQDLELPIFKREFINLKDYLRNLTKKYRKLFGLNLSYILVNGENKLDPAKKSEVLAKASAWYLCSLYPLWKNDENLKKYFNDPNLKPLFGVLDSFSINQVFGLPWIAANDLLEEIQLLSNKN